MAKPPDFMQKQMEFSAHVRNPALNPAPHDIEPRRMKIYADLFYNNIESLIGSGFPVLRRITSDNHWHRLIRSFYQHHKSKTPYFLKISEEFLAYLKDEHQPNADDPPFLLELAHYEWVELALSVLDEEENFANLDAEGDLCQGIPVLSNAVWSLAYQFPVHKISPEFLPDRPSATPTFLILYRDSGDQVRFLEINSVTARLVQLLQNDDAALSGEQLLNQIAAELQHPQPTLVMNAGRDILQNLRNKGVILGTRKEAVTAY